MGLVRRSSVCVPAGPARAFHRSPVGRRACSCASETLPLTLRVVMLVVVKRGTGNHKRVLCLCACALACTMQSMTLQRTNKHANTAYVATHNPSVT